MPESSPACPVRPSKSPNASQAGRSRTCKTGQQRPTTRNPQRNGCPAKVQELWPKPRMGSKNPSRNLEKKRQSQAQSPRPPERAKQNQVTAAARGRFIGKASSGTRCAVISLARKGRDVKGFARLRPKNRNMGVREFTPIPPPARCAVTAEANSPTAAGQLQRTRSRSFPKHPDVPPPYIQTCQNPRHVLPRRKGCPPDDFCSASRSIGRCRLARYRV